MSEHTAQPGDIKLVPAKELLTNLYDRVRRDVGSIATRAGILLRSQENPPPSDPINPSQSEEHPLDGDNPTWREEEPSGHPKPLHDDGRDVHPGNQ